MLPVPCRIDSLRHKSDSHGTARVKCPLVTLLAGFPRPNQAQWTAASVHRSFQSCRCSHLIFLTAKLLQMWPLQYNCTDPKGRNFQLAYVIMSLHATRSQGKRSPSPVCEGGGAAYLRSAHIGETAGYHMAHHLTLTWNQAAVEVIDTRGALVTHRHFTTAPQRVLTVLGI